MTQRILISTGGSGGHVVPATILYEHLKNNFNVSMSIDYRGCLLYTSPSPRDRTRSRMPSSA